MYFQTRLQVRVLLWKSYNLDGLFSYSGTFYWKHCLWDKINLSWTRSYLIAFKLGVELLESSMNCEVAAILLLIWACGLQRDKICIFHKAECKF